MPQISEQRPNHNNSSHVPLKRKLIVFALSSASISLSSGHSTSIRCLVQRISGDPYPSITRLNNTSHGEGSGI